MIARLLCFITGHYWDYSYGTSKVRCIRCGCQHPGRP